MMNDRLKILFVASEIAPFSKTGGLADVSAALPSALAAAGCEVRVVTPRYGSIDRRRQKIVADETAREFTFEVRGRPIRVGFGRWTADEPGLSVFFVECGVLYDRPGVYGDPFTGMDYADNDYRYILLTRAAFELCDSTGWKPDVFHGNDWQSGLLPFWLFRAQSTGQFANARTLMTIHNIAYHGLFGFDTVARIDGAASYYYPEGPLEFHGQMCFLRAGLEFANAVNTVSPTYAREIQSGPEFGYGMEKILRARGDDVIGILNGLDVETWNPATDRHIPATYSRDNLDGKKLNKEMLCRQCGFPYEDEVPLIGMISRVVAQKGFEILIPVIPDILDLPCRMIVLGSGDGKLEQMLTEFARTQPGRFFFRSGYDEEFAHRIEAGADVFLMPSKYEPCGLNQMMSMRYGTLPVVRATGGLADTVFDADADPQQGTGFSFHRYHSQDLLRAVQRAHQTYANKSRWRAIQLLAMSRDFSWNRSAELYKDLYQSCLLQPGYSAPSSA
ncbi:glycogen synthase GlgA [bacterium]|nr:glycogen synthase GlgA [bacterium]MBU1984698.1 glycogen synthase GlgA [bacterium]